MRRARRHLVLLPLLVAVSCAMSVPARATTITVTSTADVVADDGVCSLREAVAAANANVASGATPGECVAGSAGADTVVFDLGAGTPSIALGGGLAIAEPIVIDGATGGATRVELNGEAAGETVGIVVTAGSSTLRSLVINRFQKTAVSLDSDGNVVEDCRIGTDAGGTLGLANGSDGVLIYGNDNVVGGTAPGAGNVIAGNVGRGVEIASGYARNVVRGNRIGTNAAGTAALGNGADGVLVFGDHNTIGGTEVGAGNVIADSGQHGVHVYGGAAVANRVEGNLVGTDVTGTVDLGNTANGVQLDYGATENVVGGTTDAARNVISGNDLAGIALAVGASNNVIQGNRIGTRADGGAALGNGTDGVQLKASGNQVGGADPGAGNVISGNGLPSGSGIYVEVGITDNVILGNRIGTNAAGTAALPNAFHGVQVRGNHTTLGGAGGGRNLISGNGTSGVFFTAGASENQVAGNWIGVAADGVSPLGNARDGITLGSASTGGASQNTIGYDNLIAFNGRDGVRVTLGTRNAILHNRIFGNTQLGIDLGGNGVTANDAGPPPDADTGPNDLQNFPVLTTAAGGGGAGIAVAGTLVSAPSMTFTVEFFSSATCDATNGEGAVYLGAVGVSADASGVATIDTVLAVDDQVGQVLTATATDVYGNTSEFSACRVVAGGGPTTSTTTTSTTTSTTTTTVTTTTTSPTSTTVPTTTTTVATTTTTTSTTAAPTTTTTAPPVAEICDNCVDDDGDGLVDLDDDDCCDGAALALQRARLRTRNARTSLALRAELPGAAFGLAHDGVGVQITPAGGTPLLCSRIAADRFRTKGKRITFVDRRHAEPSAHGVDRVTMSRRRGNRVGIDVAGTGLTATVPASGVLEVVVAVGGRCHAVSQPFRTFAHGAGLRAP